MVNLLIDQQAISNDTQDVSFSYYSYVRPEILKLVPTSAIRILDVGCGAGTLGTSIKSRQKAEVHGVELMSHAASKAEDCLDHIWNCPVESALPELVDGYYDCIVAADVLEHVTDPWNTLIDLKEKLAPDGRIVVSLPNVQNWDIVSDLLAGKWDYRGEGILDRTHLHFFTRKSVEELFWNAGLRLVYMGTTTRGTSLPNNLAQSFWKNGLMADSLTQDAETWQFLVVAEKIKYTHSPRVAVIILNWNGKEDTLECLASVKQLDYPNYEVVVVDNGSTDDSVDVISKQYPDTTLLQTGANLGYAGGNNVGIRWALDRGADYVLVLNNDTVVDKNMLSHLVMAGFLDDRLGVIGPTNYYYSKPNTVWATGAMLGNPPESGYRTLGDGDPDSFWKIASQVDAVVGSAMLIKRSVFDKIHLFDENFFLCFEELDFCARAQYAGFKCYFVPEAKIWHKVGSSLGGVDSPLRTYFNVRNRLLWAKKNLPRQSMVNLHRTNLRTLGRIFLPKWSLPETNTQHLKKLLWSYTTWLKTVQRNLANPMNQAKLMALRDYYLGRFGNCPPKVRTLRKQQEKS
ncbi:MAG: methyltransferase domain-containing protein [Candidatus Nitrotoga sp.]|nr:methyltransferase domain-containing protein [Candidatus Nitrotoga sp.]MDP1856324.1 methyltransferase domain-containing protein [Candidatus Nitrotoga sp.]